MYYNKNGQFPSKATRWALFKSSEVDTFSKSVCISLAEPESNAVADFPDGGRQPLSLGQKHIIWQDFCHKLHENERNWTGEGGGGPWRPISDPQ